MAQKQEAPSPIQIQKYLGGLDYPVGKQEILDKAREEGADDELLEILDGIPDREYASPIAVSKEVGKLH